MKKAINLGERTVEYTLRESSRSRAMKLSVYLDGDFVVTAPKNTHLGAVERFIMEKTRWVLDTIDRLKSEGKDFLFLKNKRGDYQRLKEEALRLAWRKTEEFNLIYRFPIRNIRIKNQKTRWGSCSKKGNLNFNYKIALLSEKLSDYVIVHEICHLGEFNHSKNFWDLVSRVIPDYKERRRELRKIKFR